MSRLRWFTTTPIYENKHSGQIRFSPQWYTNTRLSQQPTHQFQHLNNERACTRTARDDSQTDGQKQASCHFDIECHRQLCWHEFTLFAFSFVCCEHAPHCTESWSKASQSTSLNNWTMKAHVHEPLEMIHRIKQSKTSWLSSCISESSTVIFCLDFLWNRKAHFMINWLLFFVLEVSVSSMLSKEYALTCKSQLMAITALQIPSLSSASLRWRAWDATKWKESG